MSYFHDDEDTAIVTAVLSFLLVIAVAVFLFAGCAHAGGGAPPAPDCMAVLKEELAKAGPDCKPADMQTTLTKEGVAAVFLALCEEQGLALAFGQTDSPKMHMEALKKSGASDLGECNRGSKAWWTVRMEIPLEAGAI